MIATYDRQNTGPSLIPLIPLQSQSQCASLLSLSIFNFLPDVLVTFLNVPFSFLVTNVNLYQLNKRIQPQQSASLSKLTHNTFL